MPYPLTLTLYPPCITAAEICNFCYMSQSCITCSNGRGPNPCSSYCDTNCNTICVTAQTFCNLGVETVVDHADIVPWPSHCYVKDEFIFRNWTSEMWNDQLYEVLEATDKGQLCTQEESGQPGKPHPQPYAGLTAPDPQNIPHPSGSLVTADFYNQMVDHINWFNKSLDHVKGASEVGCVNADVIRGTHAMAIFNGFNTMKWNKDVCDVCNVADQNRNACNCSCNCNCGCLCACTCQCGCSSGGR